MNEDVAREFAQQQLIQDIVDELHTATRDEDNYYESFADVAMDLMHHMLFRKEYQYHEMFEKLVLPKIEAFTTCLVERKYLEGLLLGKLINGSIVTHTTSEYTRNRLLKRD